MAYSRRQDRPVAWECPWHHACHGPWEARLAEGEWASEQLGLHSPTGALELVWPFRVVPDRGRQAFDLLICWSGERGCTQREHNRGQG